MNKKMDIFVLYFLRLALAASFLSAVADRFGYWGAPGSPGVVWGNFQNFADYTGLLNWFLPQMLITPLAWIATVLEIILGVLLIVGFQTRITALASAFLLATFALTMIVAFGFKGPLDYSVFTACAAALALSRRCVTPSGV